MRKEQDKKRERLQYQFEKEYCSERDERMGTYQAAHGIKLRVIDCEEMELIKKSIERLGGYVARENELIDEGIHLREEEKKKSEEVKIQAEKERVEKERKEHERFINRIDGVWVSTARWIEIMKLHLKGNTLSGTSHWKIDNRECVFTLSGTWDGNNFYIQSTAIRNISGQSGHFTFCGTVNKAGKILNGYFIDNSKEKTQQIFIKQ